MTRRRQAHSRVTSPLPSSAEALLRELAADGGEVSLPRLCKRLGLRMSVLMRLLAALGDTPIGDAPALGYVSVRDDGERQHEWQAQLSVFGRKPTEDQDDGARHKQAEKHAVLGEHAEEAFRLLIERSFRRRPVQQLVDLEPALGPDDAAVERVVAAADLAVY